MPLLLPSLQQPLTLLFTQGTKAAPQAAEVMANAYVTYTSLALFGAGVPIFTGAEKAVLKATILAVLNPALMNPAGLATAWSAGISAFWTSPPIVVAGPAPGTVSACPGAISLLATLTALCIIPGQPAAVAAAGMAIAIDAATKTTIATLTIGGVPTPTPIV